MDQRLRLKDRAILQVTIIKTERDLQLVQVKFERGMGRNDKLEMSKALVVRVEIVVVAQIAVFSVTNGDKLHI